MPLPQHFACHRPDRWEQFPWQPRKPSEMVLKGGPKGLPGFRREKLARERNTPKEGKLPR